MPVINIELSEREQEILRLVATGASNKEVAQELFISANTVKVHLRNIYAKIGAGSRTEAAMYAVRTGLVPAPSQGGEIEPGEVHSDDHLDAAQQDVEDAESRKKRVVNWGPVALLAVVAFGAIGLIFFVFWQSAPTTSANLLSASESLRWQVLTAMPTARYGLAMAAYEDSIYAIGGHTGQTATNVVERYEPDFNIWTGVSSKPTPVYDASAAVLGGKIYVPGGRLSSGQVSDILEIYDPRSDTWSQGPAMPAALSAYALAAFEGRLYVFGGSDGENHLVSVYEYDPQSEEWRQKTSMPTARSYAGAALAGRKIFVVGGYDGKRFLQTNEIYQPDLDQGGGKPWSVAGQLPSGRYGMGVTSIADVLLVVGGEEERSTNPPTLEYFPQKDEWQAVERLGSESWIYLGVAPFGTQLYIFGGKLADQPTDMALSYQAIYTLAIPIVPQSEGK